MNYNLVVNKYKDTDKDIHKRIYQFILRVFRLIRKIPQTPGNVRIIDQISGSLTSMGANDQEAEAAGSKKDFILKYSIVKKETKETYYWLHLINDLQLLPFNIDSEMKECKEILNVVSSIILSCKINLK